ncbi:MAG: extracellular solute-binding protein [Spirochaetaceae bacterium]|nr:extracellular solute-binding protein [Spirochaetaceae bacterium]
MLKKNVFMLVPFLLFGGMLYAGGGGQAADAKAGKVELTFYYPTQVGGNLAQRMEKIVSGFNANNGKGITVIPVYTGSYKQTAQKAMSDIAAGNGPDVVLSGMLDIVDYYGVGAVRDISDYIKGEGADWQKDFIDGFWGNFVFEDGGIYGLPFQHSVCVLYYNMDILNAAGITAPPSTQEEMLRAAAAVRAYDKNIVPVEFPADVWVLEALTLSSSDMLVKNRRETNFNSPAAVSSLDFLRGLVNGGAMIQSYAAAAEDFVAESCAMMFNTTGNLGFVSQSAAYSWGVTMMPVKTSPGLSYGGGGMIMIAGQNPEKEAASWEFMKYMTSPEVSAQWMTVSGYFAVRKSSNDLKIVKDYYAVNPQVAQAAELLKYTQAQWSTDKYWDVYAYMQTALDNTLIGGNAQAAGALAKAQSDSMALFK